MKHFFKSIGELVVNGLSLILTPFWHLVMLTISGLLWFVDRDMAAFFKAVHISRRQHTAVEANPNWWMSQAVATWENEDKENRRIQNACQFFWKSVAASIPKSLSSATLLVLKLIGVSLIVALLLFVVGYAIVCLGDIIFMVSHYQLDLSRLHLIEINDLGDLLLAYVIISMITAIFYKPVSNYIKRRGNPRLIMVDKVVLTVLLGPVIVVFAAFFGLIACIGFVGDGVIHKFCPLIRWDKNVSAS